ncbi:jg4053 [Pararge aegeria aegeria]|uniref:Jg4053 protein n=1 Tax=Pararge aegeria aegeria TaxID=348720 RepID=A0A8S4R5D8_9NEOP|nr:jg4053 [Pararge aegeria aegeria]
MKYKVKQQLSFGAFSSTRGPKRQHTCVILLQSVAFIRKNARQLKLVVTYILIARVFDGTVWFSNAESSSGCLSHERCSRRRKTKSLRRQTNRNTAFPAARRRSQRDHFVETSLTPRLECV